MSIPDRSSTHPPSSTGPQCVSGSKHLLRPAQLAIVFCFLAPLVAKAFEYNWSFDGQEQWASDSVAALQEAGWTVNGAADDDTAFFVSQGGYLELANNTVGTPRAELQFGTTRSGEIRISAGLWGSQNQRGEIALAAGDERLGFFRLDNFSTLEVVFGDGDDGWTSESLDMQPGNRTFKDYVIRWRVDRDGGNGTLTFLGDGEVLAGPVPFRIDAIPDTLALSVGWSAALNRILRIDALDVAHLPGLLGKDPDKVFPQGKRFPIFGYGGDNTRVVNDGFTMLGRMYSFRESQLLFARDNDTWVIAPVSGPWSKNQLTDGEATPEEIETVIRERIEEYLKMEGEERIGWWYLMPEELRRWRAGEMEYLEIAADTIRATDPRNRPVWMYDPGHRDASDLRHTAAHLDILGKGMYTNYSGMRDDRVWTRWTIEQQQQAVAEANPAAIQIAVAELFQDPGEEFHELIPDWVRHDVYSALITGAQGVAVFTFWLTRPDLNGIGEQYYAPYVRIAGEMGGELGLGDVFLFGTRRDRMRVEVDSGPATIEMEYRGHEEVYPSVNHADIVHGRERYFFAVNSALEAVEGKVTGLPRGKVWVESLFDETPGFVAEGEWPVALDAYEVKGFRIVPFADSGLSAVLAPREREGVLEVAGIDPDAVAEVSWIQESGPDGAVFENDGSTSTAVSFSRPGVYGFRSEVRLKDGGTRQVRQSVQVRPYDYAEFRRDYFGADGSLSTAPGGDASGDGISNLLNYAFGRNPQAGSPPPVSEVLAGSNGDEHWLSLYFAPDPLAEVDITPLWSPELSPGSWRDEGIETFEWESGWREARLPLPGDTDSAFLRLAVSLRPQPHVPGRSLWFFADDTYDVDRLEEEGWSFSGDSFSHDPATGFVLDNDQDSATPTAILNLGETGAGKITVGSSASGTTNIHGRMLLRGPENQNLAGLSYLRANTLARGSSSNAITADSEGAESEHFDGDRFSPTPTAERPGVLVIEWDEELAYSLTYRVGDTLIYSENGILEATPHNLRFSAGFDSATNRRLHLHHVSVESP